MKNLEVNELEKVFEVDPSDFDKFVKEIYKQEYFVQMDYEIHDSHQLFRDITGKLEDDEVKELEEFKKSGIYSMIGHILFNDLCRQGLIKPGHYLISDCY